MQTNSSRRPTIGVLTADCAPSIGGIGRHVESLCAGMRAAGFTVHVFDLRTLRSHRFGKNILASLCMGPAVSRWIKEKHIDVLHVHGGPGGVLPLSRFGLPLLITANHTYAQQARVPGQWWKWPFVIWERRGYRLADRIVCISSGTRDVLLQQYGLAPEKVSVAECGFDLAPWIAADREMAGRDSLRCVFAGRPHARKGWDILLRAWVQVRAQVPEARLEVVGFTGVPLDGITYRGRLDDTELQSLVGSSHLLLMPSRVEGFGLAAAEAIAAGTPVVGCDVAGLRSVVESGRTGVLTAVDAPHFAAVTIGLLRDRREWTALHDGCRGARERFAAARETAAYEAAYAAVYSAA